MNGTPNFRTGGQIIVDQLRIHGVDTIFCVPGESYLATLDAILEKDWLHGISHITGGGMVENTHRVIEEGQDIDVNWDTWSWPEIFNLIQKYGEVPIDDMRRSFNLGMGLVLIIDPASLDELSEHLSSLSEEFTVIGK